MRDEFYFQAMLIVCATFTGAVLLRYAGWFCNASRGPRVAPLPILDRGTLLLIVFLVALIDAGFVLVYQTLFPPAPVLRSDEDDPEALLEFFRKQTQAASRTQVHARTEIVLRVVLAAGMLTGLLTLLGALSPVRAFLMATWYAVLWAWQAGVLLFLFGIPKLLPTD